MPTYKISILTSADTSGLQQASQATDKLAKGTRDLQAEMAKATQAYRDAQQPAAAAAGSSQKLGEAMGGAETKANALLQGLKKVGNAIPGFQFALGAVTNVWVLLALAIVTVIAKLKEFHDAMMKEQERRRKVFEDLRKDVERYSAAIQQARLDTEEFNREFEATRNQEETPTQEGARAAAATKRRFGAAKARLGGQRQLELARIDRREAGGELTAAQADVERRRINQRFDSEVSTNDLNEQAELAGIARRTAAQESGRADQLRGRLPGARDAVTEAEKRRVDAETALKAAMEFAGLDENLKPIEGGRTAIIQKQLAATTPGQYRSFEEKMRLRKEMESLRGSVIEQRRQLGAADLDLGSARDNFGRLRSGALAAEQAAGGLRTAAAEQSAEFATAAGLAPELEALASATAGEQSSAAALKEAARLQAETAKTLREVVKSLGDGLTEVRGLKSQAADLQSRSRSNIQSE